MTAVSADEPGHEPLTPLLLDIIHQQPFQVNHQYDAQSGKQKRGGLDFPLLLFRLDVLAVDQQELVLYNYE